MRKPILKLSTALAATLCCDATAWAQLNTSTLAAPSSSVTPAGAPSAEADEIIVTATRRTTGLQHTPIAVSAFSQAQLDRQQIVNAADLQRFVPSLQFTQQAANGAVLLTLRGIGNDAAFTDTSDPEVAFYVDGIYSARPQGGSILLYDLERAEVLRGPQGTLFGRNTTAGAISLTTAKAKTDEISGNVELIGGSYNRFGSRGAINIPITGTLAARLSFASEQHDGYATYQDAPHLPGVDPGLFVTSGKRYYSQDQKSARLSLSWTPNSRFHWNVDTEGFLDQGGPDVPLLQNPLPGQSTWSVLADTAPINDRYAISVRSTMDYEISDYLETTYIAGYNRSGGTSQSESDGGLLPILTSTGGFTPYGSEQNRTVWSRNDYVSHELQLKSRGHHLIEWIVGGIYSHEEVGERFDIDDRDGYRGGPSSFSISFLGSGTYTDSYAGFGQATLNLTHRLRLTGGLRYSSDTKGAPDTGSVTLPFCPATLPVGSPPCRGIEGQFPTATGPQLAALLGPEFQYAKNDVTPRTFDKLTYLARAEYDLTDNILAYGGVSTGFKSGILTATGLGQITGPETLTDYEFGTKMRLLDRKLTLNLAGYYYDFKGYQVGEILVVRDAAGNLVSSSLQTLNADGATAYGFEAEASGALTRRDHVQLSLAVQKTKLKSLLTLDQRFDNDPTDTTALRQLAGNELPHSPRFSATLTYEHDFELPNGGTITPRGTVHYETASYLSIFNGDRTNRVLNGQPFTYGRAFDQQSAYTRGDLAIRYTPPKGRYVFEAFVQNIEDGKIRTEAETYNNGSVAPGAFRSLLQQPRTLGARLKASF